MYITPNTTLELVQTQFPDAVETEFDLAAEGLQVIDGNNLFNPESENKRDKMTTKELVDMRQRVYNNWENMFVGNPTTRDIWEYVNQ